MFFIIVDGRQMPTTIVLIQNIPNNTTRGEKGNQTKIRRSAVNFDWSQIMRSFDKQNDSEVTKKSLGSPKWSEKEDYPVSTLWFPLVNSTP